MNGIACGQEASKADVTRSADFMRLTDFMGSAGVVFCLQEWCVCWKVQFVGMCAVSM